MVTPGAVGATCHFATVVDGISGAVSSARQGAEIGHHAIAIQKCMERTIACHLAVVINGSSGAGLVTR